MGRIIVANRHGHQLVEWDTTTDTDEAREAIADAQRIIEEARANGAAISKKVNGEHVMTRSIPRSRSTRSSLRSLADNPPWMRGTGEGGLVRPTPRGGPGFPNGSSAQRASRSKRQSPR